MALELLSLAFTSGALIPEIYTCDGQDISPEIHWRGTPDGTKSFVLIVDDPDAPMGTWDHWVLFNIPGEVSSLCEAVKTLPSGTKVGQNSWKRNDYGGPCPPDREHRYFFKLYALSDFLDLTEGATKAQVEAAMKDFVIEQSEFMRRYNRPGNP